MTPTLSSVGRCLTKKKKWRIHSMFSGQRKRRVIFCKRSSSSPLLLLVLLLHMLALPRGSHNSHPDPRRQENTGLQEEVTLQQLTVIIPRQASGKTASTSGHMFQNKTFNLKDYIHPKKLKMQSLSAHQWYKVTYYMWVSISFFCYFIRTLYHILEGNSVRFTLALVTSYLADCMLHQGQSSTF